MNLIEKQRKAELMCNLKEIILMILEVIIISKLILTFVLYIGYVPTGSMTPTIPIGDKIVVWKLNTVLDKETKGIKRGDMIAFNMVETMDTEYQEGEPEITQMAKRVIALGGDTIKIDDGKVYVNGQEIDEGYVKYPNIFYMDELKVPEREMFVMGDNRANSYDSRLWDNPTISIDEVQGKIILVIPSLQRLRKN